MADEYVQGAVYGGAPPPTQATASLSAPSTFRDYATNKGYKVDWNKDQGVLINNNPYDLANMGLKLVNGHYIGDTAQYDKILKNLVPSNNMGVREQLEKNGFHVGYNPTTKEILVNGTPVNANQYGFSNVNGRYMGSDANIQALIESFKAPLTVPNSYKAQQDGVLTDLNNYEEYRTPQETTDYLNSLMSDSQKPWVYDPTKDASLRNAQGQVSQAVQEEMAARGILYSGATGSNIAAEMGKLVPTFEQNAYSRYSDQMNQRLQMSQQLMTWDNDMYARKSDQYTRLLQKGEYLKTLSDAEREDFKILRENMVTERQYAFDQEEATYNKKQDNLENAYKRLDALGYVDNESSKILGIPVGTEVGWAKEIALNQKNAIEMQKIKKQDDMDMLKEETKQEQIILGYKHKLTLEEYAVQHGYDLENMTIEQKNQLQRDAILQGYEIENKAIDQTNTLEQYAIQHGYDLENMSVQQKQDLETLYTKDVLAQGNSVAGNVGSLGSLSEKYESNGNPGTIANNAGDVGGKSYGAWQIANNTGTLDSFLGWLKSNYADTYKSLMANGAKKADGTFDSNWKNLANSKPDVFKEQQRQFIEATHYTPLKNKIKKDLGLDITTRSKALQDVVWSTAVQHGGATGVFNSALKGKNISKMSDGEIIEAVYKARTNAINSSGNSSSVKKSVVNRYKQEKKDALATLSKEEFPVGKRDAPMGSAITAFIKSKYVTTKKDIDADSKEVINKTVINKTGIAGYLLDQAQNGVNEATLKPIETQFGITNKDYENAIKGKK